MKEKRSVREMNARERLHHSLAAKVFRATLLSCVILGLVALVIGLTFYTLAFAQGYITTACSVAQSAYSSVVHGADGQGLCNEVMEIYRSLTPEERADPQSREYLDRFAHLAEGMDYEVELNIVNSHQESGGVNSVYVGMYDRDIGALVYVIDSEMYQPDTEEAKGHPPGSWEQVERRELDCFMNNWESEDRLYYIGHTAKAGWVCTAGVPILQKGSLLGFVLVDVTLADLVSRMKDFVIRFSVTLLVVTALLSLLSLMRFRRALVEPVNAIAEAAQQYLEDKRNGVEAAEHFSRLNIRTGDEIENLTLTMADMERDLAEYETSLTAVTAEKERIATELNMAAGIQANMLPNTFPAFPERREFGIYATMAPAKEVGGDFYDFFLVDEDHLALVMGDVSGKGIPAALFMMTSRTMLKDAALSRLDPAAVLERVNAQLCENNPDYMFVTVWLGILEISTGKLTWADAGHEKLFLYQNGAWSCLPKRNSIALGVLEPELMALEEEPPFRNSELVLRPGEMLFQYTDGVTEAMTADRAQFGMERLREALDSAGGAKPEELLPVVRERLDAFVQGAPQFDDITMLALEYRGNE